MKGKIFASLQRYSRPQHFADFADFDRSEYYVCFGQHRDSDTLTRSNHREALRRLGGESETVRVIRDSHFLVGWVEAIYIHESNTEACELADTMCADIESYPVLSDDDWSMLQSNEAFTYWQQMSVSERVHVCQRFGVSVFAARRSDDIPDDPQGRLMEYLSDGV